VCGDALRRPLFVVSLHNYKLIWPPSKAAIFRCRFVLASSRSCRTKCLLSSLGCRIFRCPITQVLARLERVTVFSRYLEHLFLVSYTSGLAHELRLVCREIERVVGLAHELRLGRLPNQPLCTMPHIVPCFLLSLAL
jgi:hypothetical protein